MKGLDRKKIKEAALGGLTQNPTFVLVLGICHTLAKTDTFLNALYLALATAMVLIASNVIISLLRKVIPDEVRIPAYIFIVACLVAVVDLFFNKFMYEAYEPIAAIVQLIAVNCIILARAESFAGKNNVLLSLIDGVSMGAGFTVVLCAIGGIRELLAMAGLAIFQKAAGGFIVLALLMGLFNYLYGMYKQRKKTRLLTPEKAVKSGAGGKVK